MIFDRVTTQACIIPTPPQPDARCDDPDFSLQHPAICANSSLIIKPDVANLCVLDSVQFRVFDFANGAETEITSGVAFSSSDPSVFAIGVNSGSGTALGAGQVIITAAYGTRTVQANLTTQAQATCCEDISVATAIVVDHSNSMSLGNFTGYGSRLNYAKAVATSYGGAIAEVEGVPKDGVEVWSVSKKLSQLLTQSQDTDAITASIAGIHQTQANTDLLPVFTVAAQGLFAAGADRAVLLLVSDMEHSANADRQAIIDAAFAFKQAGGIVIVVAPRASSVLQGFDLAERVATGGFFINATNATTADVLLQLNYLKKLLCAGSCVDPGDRYENRPALNYLGFTNWEAVSGVVNLLGPGLLDLLPGNGLYIELSGQSHTVIRTIDTFDLTVGKTYRISFKAAGNQQSNASQSISASLRVGDTKLFEQTVFPAWNANFLEYNFSFTAPYDATVRLYFEQNYAGTVVPGTMLDDIAIKNETDGVSLLQDDFNDENLVYIPPACGESAEVEAIDDPDEFTVDWLNDAGDDLNHIGQFTYGVSYVTNEGETATTLVLYQNLERFAFSETVRRVNLPTPPDRVVGVNIWRSLGEGDAGAEPQNNTLYLLAQVVPGTTAYLDSEDAAAFTARYEASVTAPTSNTTAYSTGGLAYGYAPCCYYYFAGSEDLIPSMTSNTEPSGEAKGSTDGVSDYVPYQAFDYDWDTDNMHSEWVDCLDQGREVFLQYSFPAARRVSGYRLSGRTTPTNQAPPKDWELQGSNNELDWDVLDTQSNVGGWVDGAEKTFTFSPSQAYRHYRLLITASVPHPGLDCVGLMMFQLVGANETLFINNCPECIVGTLGAQAPDAPGMPDIETGSAPIQQTFNSNKCVSCGPGFVNLSTVNLVPVMTGNTAPSGVASASTEYDADHAAWKVFSRVADAFWSANAALPQYLQYKFSAAKAVAVYALTAVKVYAPKAWVLAGSADGVTWTTLDSRSNQFWGYGQRKLFQVAVPTAYQYYRITVSETFGAQEVGSGTIIAAWEIFEAAPQSVCATGTSTVSQTAADAAATSAAQAQLNCVQQFSATRSYTATCPYNEFGPSVTKTVTKFSLNDQAEADALAQAEAETLANDELDCTFSNNDQAITINDNAVASPYPSIKFVEGVTGVITKVTVTLCGLSHASPDDLEILLVSPAGTKVKLWQNCGGTTDIVNATIILDDDAGSALPDATAIVAGTYRPANYSPGTPLAMLSPAPGLPYEQTLAAFDGESANGSWSLWIFDDLAVSSGQLSCGWDLTITTV